MEEFILFKRVFVVWKESGKNDSIYRKLHVGDRFQTLVQRNALEEHFSVSRDFLALKYASALFSYCYLD